MTTRQVSRIALMVAFVLALTELVHAAPSTKERLGELNALVNKAKYAEAEAGARALLAEVEAASGASSLECAAVLDVLVEALDSAEKATSSDARELAERAVAIKEQALGPNHLDLAISLTKLANVVYQLGDAPAALPIYARALAVRETALGPDHADLPESLHNLANVLEATGEFGGARPLYERALAINEKAHGPEHTAVAFSLNALAHLLVTMDATDAARPLYERALAINEKVLGPNDVEVAHGLYGLGDLLQDTGDFAAARPLLERAVAINEKALGAEHPRVAESLRRLGSVDMKLGDFATARSVLERALAITEKARGKDHPEVADSLNELASLLSKIGAYGDARLMYERALAICEKSLGGDHPHVAVVLVNFGSMLDEIGEYATARPLFERALAINEKAYGPDHPIVGITLLNFAQVLSDTGDYAAARRMDERALAMLEKALGPDHPVVAAALNNLAVVFERTGDHAAARSLYERALAIQEKVLGPDHPDVAERLTNIGEVLVDMGDYAAARPVYERALAIQEKTIGLGHPDAAFTVRSIGAMLQNVGDYAAARSMYERALASYQSSLGPDSLFVAKLLADVARVSATQGESAGALAQALEAERIAREHLQLTSRSLSERQALRYAAVSNSGLDLALTLAGRGLDPASRRRVLDALVRSRAVVLDEIAARHHAASAATDPQVAALVATLSSARSRLASLVVRGRGDLEPETYRALLDGTQNEKETAERALAAASAGFALELSRRGIGLDEVATSLPSGAALIAFAQYRKIDLAPTGPSTAKDAASYLAFVLRSGEADPQVVDLGSAEAMDGLVAAWRREAASSGLESAYRAAGASLRARVWDRLTPAIGDASRVFVVPDGSLNLVSIAALPLDDGGYLIERGALVHYLSAERDLVPGGETGLGEGLLALGAPSYDATSMYASLRKPDTRPPLPKAKTESPALIVSAATYRGPLAACGDFASARFGPLPGTGRETREIVRLWEEHGPSTRSSSSAVVDLHDAAASETAVKRSAPGRKVLHLATHGFFLEGECKSALASTRAIAGLTGPSSAGGQSPPPPATGDNPLVLAGLALAGANHRAAAGPGEDDGILTAEEIASLDLSGVEWAVLSACDTGIGEIKAGEGVFGLRRSFQVAGARSLIMSLWSVDDEATRSWMKALYEGRLESHLDTAEAVRHADLEVLNDRRKRKLSTHPFYWAGFVAAGDWR